MNDEGLRTWPWEVDLGGCFLNKYLKVTMNLNYYACALHGILNANSYDYCLTVNLLVSKIITNFHITFIIYYHLVLSCFSFFSFII